MMLQPLFNPGTVNSQPNSDKQLPNPLKSEPLPVPFDHKLQPTAPPETSATARNQLATSKAEPATVVTLSTKSSDPSAAMDPTYEALGSAAGAQKVRV
ncbi:MAG: hypothetical protein WEA82_05135 [Idiomarina sp.]